MPTPDVGPRARDDLDIHEVEDGLVIYDTDRDRVHYLNHTATLVLALCTGANSEAVIAEQLANAFALDPAVAAAEAAACLSTLRQEGLLT